MQKLILPFFILIVASVHAQDDELMPTLTEAKLNVLVTNTADEPSEGDFITFTSKTNGKSYSGITGPEGKFSILIPKEDTYVVKYKTFGGDNNYADVEIPPFEGLLNFDFTIKFEMPKTVRLENVYFDVNKATIRPESFPSLNNVADVMKYKKTLKIEISGHTDNVGSEEHNQKLSEARANSVRSYVIKKSGAAADRITAVGHGESKPIASNDTDEGKQKNRRTEVKILSQ